MGKLLIAIVAEGVRRRIYLPANDQHVCISNDATPSWKPTQKVPTPCHDVDRLPMYGMPTWADAFTDRQLVALNTFSNLVAEARKKAIKDAKVNGWEDDGKGLNDGGTGAIAYGDALAVYLAFAVDKVSVYSNTICTWLNQPKNEIVGNSFGRQAIPMTWDFAEANHFCSAGGTLTKQLEYISKMIIVCLGINSFFGVAVQQDAATQTISPHIS